jgi:uracil-DNA glycosylase
MNDAHARALAAMDVTVWRLRGNDEPVAPSHTPEASRVNEPSPSSFPSQPATPPEVMQGDGVVEEPFHGENCAESLDALREIVSTCTRCTLATNRIHTVFGCGNQRADWMIIGEAPGAEEDRQGLPFVGRAGQLLNAMIIALGTRRDDVYIANVLKCRPPNNRDPLGEEVRQCSPYLREQVQRIQPKVILALGRFAAQALLETQAPISSLRGKVHRYGAFEIPLVVSYHPAYLLRSPLEKRKAWQDLQLAMRTMDEIFT